MAIKKRTTRKSSPKKATKKKLENLNSTQDKTSSKGSNHGGARKGAGRKPGQTADQQRLTGLKEMAELHALEEVDVPMMVGGQAKMVKMTRTKAILNMLWTEAVMKKNIQASKEYGDRTRGRARQEIDMTGEIKTADQYTPEDPALAIAQKAYADAIKNQIVNGEYG